MVKLPVKVILPSHVLVVPSLCFSCPLPFLPCSAIISGAVVQKMKYLWFLAFTAMWHIFVYCPLAHWFFYYNGWMFTYGVLDFAGGIVVHTCECPLG